MTGKSQKRFQKKCPNCGRRFSCEGTCKQKEMFDDYYSCYCPECYERFLAEDESRPWRISCSLLSDKAKRIASFALLRYKLES